MAGFALSISGRFSDVHRGLDIIECATASRPQLRIRSIATGSIDIFVIVSPAAGLAILTTVNTILQLINSVLQLRKSRKGYEQNAISPELIKQLVAVEVQKRDETLHELAAALLAHLPDPNRRTEITGSVNHSVGYLADRLDKGMQVEVAVLPSAVPAEAPAADSADRAKWEIAEALKNYRVIERHAEPVLALPAVADDEPEAAAKNEPANNEPEPKEHEKKGKGKA